MNKNKTKGVDFMTNEMNKARHQIDGVSVFCAFDEIVECTKLKENPRNPNTHSDEQIRLLAEIIKKTGWRAPITVSNLSGFIVKGHGRLQAAKAAGLKQCPVEYQNFKDEEEEMAALLADNKIAELAEIDNAKLSEIFKDIEFEDLSLTGYSQDEFNELVGVFEEAELLGDPDEVPEEVEPRCKLGDVWQLGKHRLMCGDSTSKADVEKLMNGEKADMVFTDPPYGMNLDTDYSKMNGANKNIEFKQRKNVVGGKKYEQGKVDDFTPEMLITLFASFDYVKEIFLWGADYFAELLPNKNEGSWIVWDKRDDNEQFDKMYGSSFELCWSKNKHKRDIARVRWCGVFGTEKEFDHKRHHPTQKPTALVQWFLDRYSKENQSIVDLFGGSGSTLIACEQNKRNAYLMELDPHYCDVIITRWETLTGKTAELIS